MLKPQCCSCETFMRLCISGALIKKTRKDFIVYRTLWISAKLYVCMCTYTIIKIIIFLLCFSFKNGIHTVNKLLATKPVLFTRDDNLNKDNVNIRSGMRIQGLLMQYLS